jgi:alcohol dehydrogenase class IV
MDPEQRHPTAFEFATDRRIIFGVGTFSRIGQLAREFGTRTMVVHGSSRERAQPLLDWLAKEGITTAQIQVSGEPELEQVDPAVSAARDFCADLVIGFGGGSAIDLAKAVAALMKAEGSVLDYIEVVGRGKALTQPGVPCLAVPTTAGTGAEVTRNSVLAVKKERVKVSLRSVYLLPQVALVDPELTRSLPPAPTAFTGMDALTQVIEPFLSVRANPLTDGLCREGMSRAARSLKGAYEHGDFIDFREDMAIASLLGGLSLANAGLGAVHGLAAPLGGMFPAPHGAICATLLPHVLAANLQALRKRAPKSRALPRFTAVSRILLDSPEAEAETAITWMHGLCQSLQVPSLRSFGVETRDIPTIVERSLEASSMKGNPIALTAEELANVLECAL